VLEKRENIHSLKMDSGNEMEYLVDWYLDCLSMVLLILLDMIVFGYIAVGAVVFDMW